MTVIHRPRVAWDGARALVHVTRSPRYQAFADHVLQRLGPNFYLQLEETRSRVLDNLARTGGDRYVTDLEAGKWRVRFADLLGDQPGLVGTVMELASMVRASEPAPNGKFG